MRTQHTYSCVLQQHSPFCVVMDYARALPTYYQHLRAPLHAPCSFWFFLLLLLLLWRMHLCKWPYSMLEWYVLKAIYTMVSFTKTFKACGEKGIHQGFQLISGKYLEIFPYVLTKQKQIEAFFVFAISKTNYLNRISPSKFLTKKTWF